MTILLRRQKEPENYRRERSKVAGNDMAWKLRMKTGRPAITEEETGEEEKVTLKTCHPMSLHWICVIISILHLIYWKRMAAERIVQDLNRAGE